MEDYNHLISSHLLDNYEGMLGNVPQPTMFGGKRLRQHPLPASTDYDYPATLAVGSLRGRGNDDMVGGSFFSDFAGMIGLGHPAQPTGGVMMRGEVPHMVGYDQHGIYNPPVFSNAVLSKGGRKIGGRFNLGGFFKNIGHALAPVGQALAPIAKDVATNVASDALVGALAAGRKPRGRPRKQPAPAPVEMEAAGRHYKKGGKKGMKGGFSFSKALKSVGKIAAPVLKDVGKDVLEKVVIPQGKKQLSNALTGMLQAQPQGGALITDHPKEFHSSVYPPALASYHPSGDAYGRGRKAKKEKSLPKSAHKRYTARGAIVAEVMKKHGLNLPQASKYVKEHNLY